MEALISKSFDNLSALDSTSILKGLRRLEGLLAQLCLPAAKSNENTDYVPKPNDAKFKEFIALQNGFEWNISLRLIACLERLLGIKSCEEADDCLLSCLDLLQGTLLLHPPSRQLFARENHMMTLLDMLDITMESSIQSATLLTLVSALLDQPINIRTFEAHDGLRSVTALFKHRSTPDNVKMKVLEFLYFYLMPEPGSAKNDNVAPSTPSKSNRAATNASNGNTRSTEEKQKTLERYLKNVDELVDDLKENHLSFTD